MSHSLWKQAYSNKLKILPQEKRKFSDKKMIIFHISAPNTDCGYSLEPPRRGGSNECPQSMFLNRNKKNNLYPCKPQFYYIKVGLKGSTFYRHVFLMCLFLVFSSFGTSGRLWLVIMAYLYNVTSVKTEQYIKYSLSSPECSLAMSVEETRSIFNP